MWADGITRVAGVDEAGRGPLAGPVVAAAVIFARPVDLPGLADSKRLTPPERERLAQAIRAATPMWAIGAADAAEIDALNILRATHLAMARALRALRPSAEVALIDGLPASGLPCPHHAIVQGDARCASIAAASILAKTDRDARLRAMDALHPGYGFARHKGYPTPEHRRALQRLGPCPIHRRTYRPVAELLVPTQLGELPWASADTIAHQHPRE
ncbi:MAG: ribonuclease HII [Armatimonadetes bacterium]|nr:ribonuclease HII [Armatimonadota bacterium]